MALLGHLDDLDDLRKCQDKLNADLDNVEIKIMQEISSKGSSFVEAVSLIHELDDSIDNILSSIDIVSNSIQEHNIQYDNLRQELSLLTEKQERIVEKQECLEYLRNVMSLQEKVQNQIDSHNFEEARILLSKAEAKVPEHCKSFIQLNKVMGQLKDMKLALRKMETSA